MSKLFIYVFLSAFCVNLGAQEGIRLNTDKAFDGYTLFENENDTYLINNCGEVLNIWDNVRYTDNHTKLLDNGNMMYIYQNNVYEVDWDGNIVNKVTHNDQSLLLEYEVILLENQNYLCAARRSFSSSQFDALGYDIPGAFPSRVDVVVELDRASGNVIWEWDITDHVIQERDPGSNNYGVVADHPELVNMDAVSTYDWNSTESFMINGMGYSPELDLVIVSVRKMSEVMIVDHSTTTTEARGSTGGNYGKGGDILYRWGNPQNYGRGTADDRILYYEHNPQWVTIGPHTGKIMMYNNGLNRPGTGFGNNYSTVPVFELPFDENGNFLLEDGKPYAPGADPEYQLLGNETATFYSGYTSGAEWMPNGNMYITEGTNGRLIEIDPTGEVVWEYYVYEDDYIFRSEKYAKDHPAFEGKDLTPMGTVEPFSSSYPCELYTSSKDINENTLNISISQNPNRNPQVIIHNHALLDLNIEIVSLQGQKVQTLNRQDSNIDLDLIGFRKGQYFMTLTDVDSGKLRTFKLIKT